MCSSDLSQYKDEYRDDLMEMIKARAKGAKPVTESAEAPSETKVIDLMDALRRSVSEQKEHGTSKRAKGSARKRKSA